jgi:hypothetical protein
MPSIQVVWVWGHNGNWWKWNNWWIRQGYSHPLIGPEPALCVSAKVAIGVIREWTSRKHEERWQPVCEQRQDKGFRRIPSAKRAGELLILSRNHLRILTKFLTGHCHLKGHLFELRLVNSPQCDRCKQASEMASHVVRDCGALATLRLGHLAHHFMEPADLKTSVSARYCTLFKVWDCWMNELKVEVLWSLSACHSVFWMF